MRFFAILNSHNFLFLKLQENTRNFRYEFYRRDILYLLKYFGTLVKEAKQICFLYVYITEKVTNIV